MKIRYVIIISGFSLLINLLSIYNLILGFLSFFLLFFTTFITLLSRATDQAAMVEQDELSFFGRQLAGYGETKIGRILHKISAIILVVVCTSAGVFEWINQQNNWDEKTYFIKETLYMRGFVNIAQFLSKVGWITFALAIVLATIQLTHLMRTSKVFTRSNS